MEGMKEYIERAAIHELVKRIPKYEMFNYDRTEALLGINPDDVDFGVDKIPAADVVEVRRGKWLDEDFPDKPATVHGMAICSVCGELSHKAEHGYNILSNYCPNCGAKMWAEAADEI